jgi:hypothetical protein
MTRHFEQLLHAGQARLVVVNDQDTTMHYGRSPLGKVSMTLDWRQVLHSLCGSVSIGIL